MRKNLTIAIYFVALAASLTAFSGYSESRAGTLPANWETIDPYEALNFYIGKWTLVGHEDDQESCSWLDGGGHRHVICKAVSKTDKGPRESIGIYSYDETTREFVYHGFGKRGAPYIERGRRIPNGFLARSDSGVGADRVRTRFTITWGDRGHVSTVNETAKGDGPFVVDDEREYLHTTP